MALREMPSTPIRGAAPPRRAQRQPRFWESEERLQRCVHEAIPLGVPQAWKRGPNGVHAGAQDLS
eukprot:5420561-Pyramimonas_sp.AAC.1